jgi:hypothetical protein
MKIRDGAKPETGPYGVRSKLSAWLVGHTVYTSEISLHCGNPNNMKSGTM